MGNEVADVLYISCHALLLLVVSLLQSFDALHFLHYKLVLSVGRCLQLSNFQVVLVLERG